MTTCLLLTHLISPDAADARMIPALQIPLSAILPDHAIWKRMEDSLVVQAEKILTEHVPWLSKLPPPQPRENPFMVALSQKSSLVSLYFHKIEMPFTETVIIRHQNYEVIFMNTVWVSYHNSFVSFFHQCGCNKRKPLMEPSEFYQSYQNGSHRLEWHAMEIH
jgi:hypothetical protein